jgi:hypothetical protein
MSFKSSPKKLFYNTLRTFLGLIIGLIITAILSYAAYGSWDYWPLVFVYGLITALFTILVMWIPFGGTVLNIFWIILWSDGWLLTLGLPYTWLIGIIMWAYMVIGWIFNVIWSLFFIVIITGNYTPQRKVRVQF